MTGAWALALLAAVALLLLWQLGSALGRARGALLGLVVVAALGGGWWLLARAAPTNAGPADWSAVASVSSSDCFKCHADHHASWHRSYHRTMTREATPADVKGDFENATYDYQGLRTRLLRRGSSFYMETVDPDWALLRARAGPGGQGVPKPGYTTFSVDRLVGSHWVQEYLHRAANGRYVRLPVLYHIVEKRWSHAHGAFLAPESDDFWGKSRGFAWNDTCLYCHNTGPSKNPVRGRGGAVVGYQTEVAELGISCEACHGPGGEHVRLNRNPARRLALQNSEKGDPSIVHPARLPVSRRDEICARCHGALVPRAQAWDPLTQRDPFIPGFELTRFNHFFWSEKEQARLAGMRPQEPIPGTEPIDGRFWGDGTPLTTALEYNGMALSPCYQNGQGQLSCLSCHSMHTADPNFMLKPGMQTNEACYQCHAGYRERLAEHTRHRAGSPGSLCYNCHMPHQVYSLLTTHRSHRIGVPLVKDSLGLGKPHACNLCHLDRSLGWTQEQLARWPGQKHKERQKLSALEESVSSALLLLTRGDARSRAVVAGAFSNPAAQLASGTDWFAPFLTRLLDHERYPVVRYLAHRGLRSVHGAAAGPYDYLARPAVRAAEARALRERLAAPLRRPLPYLPLTPAGQPDESALRRLLQKRDDPDVSIHE
jgi:predicted CXXCH cytochrome family protein